MPEEEAGPTPTCALGGKCRAGEQVVRGEVRKVAENLALEHSGGKIFQNVIDRDP